MAQSLDFEAKNVEKALNDASTKLKKSKENLKYEIISYGSTGIFGLVGRKKAKIRVTIEENKEQPKQKFNIQKKQSEMIVIDEIKEKKEAVVKEINPVDSEKDLNDSMEKGARALKKIIERISRDSNIRVNRENEVLDYQVSGGDSSRLIGKRGQTLEAIQYILEKIVNQKQEKRVRVRVDIEDYLKNKETKLVGMAEKLAAKAIKTGRPVSMGQLNAHDRRLVHIALKNDTNIRTQSQGQGFYRKLIIFPKNKKSEISQ
ncbi:MAG: Jag N-terminal domain-containing protein [Deltaproteobacteria bacterium]|nr:Jag N-terminal domain-containing protein [Deltaproteobacteria bacterium]